MLLDNVDKIHQGWRQKAPALDSSHSANWDRVFGSTREQEYCFSMEVKAVDFAPSGSDQNVEYIRRLAFPDCVEIDFVEGEGLVVE